RWSGPNGRKARLRTTRGSSGGSRGSASSPGPMPKACPICADSGTSSSTNTLRSTTPRLLARPPRARGGPPPGGASPQGAAIVSADADVLVVGAGAVGASCALHLARQGLRVVVVEKEGGPALHQSGRNSGVIHAGYNVKPGSQKARYCVEGNRRLRAYCEERGIATHPGGI